MAYDIRVGSLFDVHIDTEQEVLAIYKKATKLLFEGKTVMSWTGEADSSTLQFTLAPDLVRSECILFLKRINPTKYGYVTSSARQIRF